MNAFTPGLPCVGHFRSVDIEFENIVVRIDEGEFFFQVSLLDVNLSAHIEVGMFVTPVGSDIIQAWRAEGSPAFLPSAVVESGTLPPLILFLHGVACHPCFFVGHGGDGSELFAFATEKVVGLAINPQQALQWFLVICPVTCGAFIELVVWRPDGEIGVRHDEGYRR